MPRKSRIDAPGALHHVMARGIERRNIFNDDDDRDVFLDRLGEVLSETGTSCYAWALMPNHQESFAMLELIAQGKKNIREGKYKPADQVLSEFDLKDSDQESWVDQSGFTPR